MSVILSPYRFRHNSHQDFATGSQWILSGSVDEAGGLRAGDTNTKLHALSI
jgi:hypothetical protein